MTYFSVAPSSRTANDSPTHTMAYSPAPTRAFTLRFTSSFVSPNSSRRSEWPTIEHAQPISLIMGTDTSPVKAPFGSQYTFCAPTAILVLSKSSTVLAGLRSTNGGQMTMSSASGHSLSYWFDISCVSTTASPTVLFIFQLPAIIGLRAMGPSFPWLSAPSRRLPRKRPAELPASRPQA